MQQCHESQEPFSIVGPAKYLGPVDALHYFFISLSSTFTKKSAVKFRHIYSGKSRYVTKELITVVYRPIFLFINPIFSS
jgi:hypothetical protein